MSPPDTSTTNAPRRATIPHLPALDGLRGLAVLGVLFFHDNRLIGGYLGVDLFFVLSGYLITSLLLAEWDAAGTIDLGAFWVRRARRLFPALLSLLPAVGLYAHFVAKAEEHARIRGDGLGTLFYYANWRAIFSERSYWEMFQAPSPLEHTWSLAIEEQFYVFWPLLAFLVLRLSRGKARGMLVVSSILAVVSAGLMVWLGGKPGGTLRAYMGTDTRGAAILLGAALSCVLAKRKTFTAPSAIRWLDVFGILSAILLGIAWVKLDGQDLRLYRGGFFLTELCVLVLILCAAHGEKSFVARVLAFKPLAAVGLISYGLYLWHWPLFVLLSTERTGLSPLPLSALRFAATFAVALVSYRFLEQPIRKRGITFGKPILVVPSSVTVCLGVLLVLTNHVGLAKKGLATLRLPAVIPPGTKTILVVGDSVAQALGERMHAVQDGTGVYVAERGTPDCSILEGELPTHSLTNEPHRGGDCDARWESDADSIHPTVTLVVLGGGYFAPVEVDGKWQRPCEAGWERVYGGEVESEVRKLVSKSGKVFVAKIPYGIKHWMKPGREEMIDCFNRTISEAATRAGASVLDLGGHLCPSGSASCETMSDGEQIRPDGLHFAGEGAKKVARWAIDAVK